MFDFVPSRDKLEAVNRISALANGGPEELGPGSKERKRVLEKVVVFFNLPIDVSVNKVELGRAVVQALGGVWTDACFSTGYTITLHGLDLVLKLATAEAVRRGETERPVISAVEDEAVRILDACASRFRRTLEMRACVTEKTGTGRSRSGRVSTSRARLEQRAWPSREVSRARAMGQFASTTASSTSGTSRLTASRWPTVEQTATRS